MAKPSPIVMAIVWPAITKASNTICNVNPMAMPSSISWTRNSPLWREGSMAGLLGSTGTRMNVTARLNVTLTRIGTTRAPKTGATIRTPAIRKNGQT